MNSASSTMDAPALENGMTSDVTCKNCGSCDSWGQSTFCPKCGFYPTLGRCVEIGDSGCGYTEPQAAAFTDIIPVWAMGLAAGVAAVLGVSLYANFTLPESGSSRMWWSLAQMGIGMIAVAVGHLAAFATALMSSDKFAPMDFAMKPIEIWKPTLARLPKSVWKLYSSAWGVAGILFAAVCVGGIPYMELFDMFGASEAPKNTIVSAVVDQARQERESDMTMEEAMNAFVGEATGDMDKEKEEEEKKKAVATNAADCLVLGYIPNADGSFNTLLIAGVVNSKLRYVGKVEANQLPESDQQQLKARFAGLSRSTPFVKCRVAANWLQPKMMCRVKYDRFNSLNEMKTIVYDQLLSDVDAN